VDDQLSRVQPNSGLQLEYTNATLRVN
jgi:hypothetical protein